MFDSWVCAGYAEVTGPGKSKNMELRHYSAERLKNEVRTIIGRHLDVHQYRAFFFGSRVSGTGGERSDIDVGIEGPRAVPARALAAIREELDDIPTLYTIEVVDFSGVGDKFRRVSKQHIELLT